MMQQETRPPLVDVDLKALSFLAAVFELRSVTRAGSRVGLSQPAASRLLSQLRRAFGNDPLIVRRGGTCVLTEKAKELTVQLHDLLSAAERLFNQSYIDPRNTRRVLHITTTDYGATTVLVPLMETLSREAPGISLELHCWDDNTLGDMALGVIDLALYMSVPLPNGFYSMDLAEEQFACVVRKGHPILAYRDNNGRVSASRLAELPRVIAMHPEPVPTISNDPLEKFGGSCARREFRTPYFLAGPLLVSKTDYQLCSTRRLAELAAQMAELEIIDVPELETFKYCAVWHSRAARDPVIKWILSRMKPLSE